MHSKKTIFFISLLLLAVSSAGYSQIRKPGKFLSNYSSSMQKVKTTPSYLNNYLPVNLNEESLVVDSMICTESNNDRYKYSFSYNERSQISSYFIDLYDGEKWTNNERVNYGYYDDGSRKSSFEEYWNGNEWLPNYRKTIEYDDNGYMTLLLAEEWNGSEWVIDFRETRQNNAEGNMIYATYIEDGYEIIARFEYDSNGLIISETDSVKNEGVEWQYYTTTINYNQDKNISGYLQKIMINGQWINYTQVTYDYDSNKNLILELGKIWNDSSKTWLEDLKAEYEYDDNNNNTSVVLKSWNNTSGSWIEKERYTFEYNSAGKVLSELYEKTDDAQEWINYYRFIYEYDEQGYFSNGIYEEWSENSWQPADGYFEFDDPAGHGYFYTTAWKVEGVFYGTITGIDSDSPIVKNYSLSQNYPNPFNPETSIK